MTQTQTKFTPGPWEAHYLPQHRMRVTAENGDTICDMALWLNEYKGQMANARLIASAPDLLTALEKIVVDEENRRAALKSGSPAARFSDKRLNAARAAIAAAREEPE